MQPTPAQTGAVSRLSYLWRSAHASEEPALARVLIREVLAVAAREGVELPSSALQRMCARCCSALAPGKNCTVSQRALKRRPAAKKRVMRVRCHHCGHTATFAMPPRPSSRGSRAVPAAAPAPAPARERPRRGGRAAAAPAAAAAASAAPRAAKRKPRGGAAAAAVPAAAPSSAPDFFGFEFVPI